MWLRAKQQASNGLGLQLMPSIGHEALDIARQFTLRAIVQIAHAVQSTALAYD